MTAEDKVVVPEFGSNAQYVAWELARVHARVKAWIEARHKQDPEPFFALIEAQNVSRAAAISQRKKLVDDGMPIAFEAISRRFDLAPIEEDALSILAAMHLSTGVRELLLLAQNDAGGGYLELGFVADLLIPPRNRITRRFWADAHARLVEYGLIQVEPPRRGLLGPRLGHAVAVPHFVTAAIAGELLVDENLGDIAQLREAPTELFELILSEDNRSSIRRLVEAFNDGDKSVPSPWRIVVAGESGTGRSMLAEALARVRGVRLLTVDVARMLPADAPRLLAVAAANARFAAAALHLTEIDRAVERNPTLGAHLSGIVASHPGVVIFEIDDLEAADHAIDIPLDFVLHLDRPDTQSREQLWESLLPREASLADDVNLKTLAHTWDLTGGQIRGAVEWAVRRARADGRVNALNQADLDAGAWSRLRSRLGSLTERSTVRLSLDDLVLPEDPMRRVHELLAACRNRSRLLGDWGFDARLVTGKGLVALFLGEAGTGKTLTAEILANELDRKLHIVSIPQVVSKWVGETEKNVREIFSQARAQGSMLLFDEADSLFARRVKVERSADHYQNMEVNNLLQEIERFDGIVILTTNLETNMDPAFARRILFRIEFPVPGPEERALIWQKLLPAQTPVSRNVDFDYLGESYEITGGQIKNALVRAAYKALEDNERLTMKRLSEAAEYEASQAGRLVRALVDE